MADLDLTDLLKDWPYEPGGVNARRIEGRDGRPKLQRRFEMGIEQLELIGRPDGGRPYGCEYVIEYQRERLARYIHSTGSSVGFALSSDERQELRQEYLLLYHRYLGLFALKDYEAVIADTRRSIDILDLLRDFGVMGEFESVLANFKAEALALQVRCEADLAIEAGEPRRALEAIDRGLAELRSVFADAEREAEFDEAHETQLLRGMRDLLVPKLPASQKAELQERLRAALAAENYELAAILRDELRQL